MPNGSTVTVTYRGGLPMLTRSYGKFGRPRTALAFLLLIGGFVSPFSSTGSALAASQTLVFAAGAYGAYASVGTKVVVGTTAGIGLGCGTTSGVSKSASALSVTHPPLVTTGTVNDDVSTTTNSSEASADVQDLSIIGGAITATDVQAVSVTTLSQSVFEVSSAGSRFMGLVIAGKSISSNVPANTSIPLAGLGKVVLNEQNTVVGASAAKLTVNMIHVYVTMANSLGIANGTQIIVADASSGLTLANGPGVLGGVAYGTLVRESVLQSATAPVSLGCFGTNGKTITNT